MLLGEVTMTELEMALEKTKTLVIPFGTVEAHGSHLPLNTDALIIREVVKKAVDQGNVFMAPPLQYGVCTSTGAHPGTIGISPETLRAIVVDIVRSAYGSGFRNVCLISGHGGGLHLLAMREAGEGLAAELDGLNLAVLCVYDLIQEEIISLAETKNDSHAGEIETSIALYLAPNLVKGRAKEEYPVNTFPFITKDKLKRWPGAVWGNPAKADVDKGKKIFEVMVKKTVELIRRMEQQG
ncbi:MAG: creatininase family protein [Deltaproteobacteria bacterium]|nr:creatininase family protein [Deltaproteobacteria bacterium]